MNIYLKQLSVHDEKDVFNMLKRIGLEENSFTNPVHDMNYGEFKKWLLKADCWSVGKSLPPGYVQQSIYWLIVDKVPIGIGKIRHVLTIQSRENGGNIGYAIDPIYRNRGYGNILLFHLIKQAKKLHITELLLTVDKGNIASRRVIEKNGGVLLKENEKRWYFTFK